jgi:thiazole synthase ThiGH ThiG subunit
MDHNWTTGEVGGVLAAVLAALGAIGGFVRWALGWGQSQTKLREAKLERWEKRLTDREIEYREKIEAELGQLRTDIARQSAKHARQIAALRRHHAATRSVLLEVTVELRTHAPDSEALARAHHNLSLAFPLDPDIPDDMVAAAREIGDGE